ncbi:MAG: hypothetical protein WBC85_16960, partial [Planktotalea sp.]|uniref:hypothetical protein n=1 Tax=Planktotalea sp. TaxID=2029877 RepID=UPI003C707C27
MAHTSSTTIAAAMLGNSVSINLDSIADQILTSKIAERACARAVAWDCEDLVFLDFDALRIALHKIHEGDTQFLCLGVGPIPGSHLPEYIEPTRLAQLLVRRFTQNIKTNAVLWHDHSGALSVDVMDDFHDELESMLDYLDIQMEHAQQEHYAQIQNAPRSISASDDVLRPADDKTEREKSKSSFNDDEALRIFRHYICSQHASRKATSAPMHASIYVIACTFLFMAPAVG